MEFNKVADEGNHQSFETGSVRDSAVGKGTPHLIAGEALHQVLLNYNKKLYDLPLEDLIVCCYRELLIFTKVEDNVPAVVFKPIQIAAGYAYTILCKLEGGKISEGMRRLAQHYENGAKKYSPNNWRKGQPISRYYDSAMRHLWKLMDGLTDEDHAAALLWNLLCILQTRIDIMNQHIPTTLDDFPFRPADIWDEEIK